MKAIRAILLLLTLGLSTYGQGITITASAIKVETVTGDCRAGGVRLKIDGTIQTCQSGTWGDLSTGGSTSEISQSNATNRSSSTANGASGRRLYDAVDRWWGIKYATKSSHGFAVLDPIYNDSSGVWQKALATSNTTLPTAIVTKIIDANTFEYATAEGEYTFTAHGLSTSNVYYLQDAGGLGTSAGTVSYVVGAPTGTNTFQYYGMRTVNAVSSVFGRTGVVAAATNDYTWAQINKSTSSLADITTRSASDLSSGTLPDARFPSTLPALNGSALTALNASNLASGTVPTARLGSGTADSTTYLRGDGSWQTVSGSVGIGGTVTSGTAGSLLFVGSGPVLAQDNSNLYWDDANNRLGIGTTSPGASVETTGIFRATGSAAPASGAGLEIHNNAIISFNRGAGTRQPLSILASTLTFTLDNPVSYAVGVSVASYIQSTTTSAPASGSGVELQGGSTPSILAINRGSSTYLPLTVNASTLALNTGTTGNVGIVTSAPDKALEINSAAGNNLRLTYNDSNGSAANYVDFATTSGGNLTITPSGGAVNIAGVPLLTGTPQTLTGAGVVNLTTYSTLIVTTSADALTLAAGSEGQHKFIRMKTDGGDGTLTVTNGQGFTTITFNDAGDYVLLFYQDSRWHVITNSGCVIA